MGRYLGKRLISTIPLLLVISFVVFMFIHMIPGDPARLVAGQDATKEDVAVVREQLGLDEPLLVQYGKYMKGLFTGDLGNSIKNGKTVAETIAPRLKPTIMLTFSSMIWAAIIGIAIGIIAAVFHGRILDYVGMIIAIAGISVPSFWLGLELIQLFSVSLGWLPTSGLETWKSYILPSLTMGAGIMAVLARFSRSSMLETMREDYVRTARAKGLSESLVVMRHAFKNSLIEIVTVAGLQIGGLLSGSVMAETVFSIPGLGRLLVDSIQMRDYKVVQALLLSSKTPSPMRSIWMGTKSGWPSARMWATPTMSACAGRAGSSGCAGCSPTRVSTWCAAPSPCLTLCAAGTGSIFQITRKSISGSKKRPSSSATRRASIPGGAMWWGWICPLTSPKAPTLCSRTTGSALRWSW